MLNSRCLCSTNCQAGKFGAVSGLSVCAHCTSGKYSNPPSNALNGAIDCTCDLRSSFTVANTVAWNRLCDPGTYSQFVNSSTTCLPCGTGTSQPNSGASACVNCLAGSYSGSQGAVQCQLCTPGTLTNTGGQSSCDSCTPGKISKNGQVCLLFLPASELNDA